MAITSVENNKVEQGEQPGRWAGWRPHLVALAFYTLLTVLFAWPALLNLGTGTPGHFEVDRNQNLWNFWWFKRSLLETQTNPFHTDFLFYPYGANLYLHTFSPYNLIIGLPLQLLFGLVPAYGFIELLTFPLGGYCAYLLARHLVPGQWGPLLAGMVWSFGPYHFVELRQEQLNLLSLQWLPLVILFLFKLEQAHTRPRLIRYGLTAALFYFLTLMVDYYYAIYLLMFAALYWLWRAGERLWQWRQGRVTPSAALKSTVHLTARMLGVFGLGMLAYSPVLAATVRETASPRYAPLDNLETRQVHSTDLLKMFFPPAHHPWWGDNFESWKGLGLAAGETNNLLNNWGAVLGFVAVGLSIYALLKVRGLWFWAFQSVFWIVISLGPSLRFNGVHTGIWLPYRLLAKVPFVGIGRFPERYMLMAQLGFAILGAYGLAHLLQKVPAYSPRPAPGWRRPFPLRAALGSVVLLAFFIESWPGVLPPPDPVVPPGFIAAIEASRLGQTVPAGRAIFELPVTKHGNPDSPRMLNQIYHQRPITGGYISRDLVDPHRTANDYSLYDWLGPASLEPDIVPARTGPEQLGLLSNAGMGFVVVYGDDFRGDRTRRERIQKLLDLTFGTPGQARARPFYEDQQARVYLVPPTRLEKPVIVLGQGWSEPEPAGGQRQRWIQPEAREARLNLVVGPDTPRQDSYTLELEAVNPSPDRPRRLQVFLNGQVVADVRVEGVSPVTLPGLKLLPGDNILALRPDPADGFFVPAQADPQSTDRRQLRLGFLSIKFKD